MFVLRTERTKSAERNRGCAVSIHTSNTNVAHGSNIAPPIGGRSRHNPPVPITVTITVDNRVRISPAEVLPDVVVRELKMAFQHDNPEYAKKRRMNLPTYNEPPAYRTWEVHRRGEGDGVEYDLSFPRGGYARVKACLDSARISFKVRDRRTSGAVTEFKTKIPDHKYTLYDYQQTALEAAITKENCIVRAPTGCIAGDAIVGINRAGKGSKMRIDHVVKMFNGGKTAGRTWDREIPTFVRCRTDGGFVRLARLLDAYVSGVKTVFEITTATGHKVRATEDHRFLTTDGWKRLGEVSVGDRVFVEDARRKSRTSKKAKNSYQIVNGLRSHPYAGRKGVRPDKGGHSVPMHRLVVEARINGYKSTSLFIAHIRAGKVDGLKFLDPKEFHVHHEDENHKNNADTNLVIKSVKDHHREHGVDGGWRHVAFKTISTRVKSIRQVGRESTYDLALEEPHNFLANGIVVHNSGKTTVAFGIAAKLKLPTLIIVWAGNLFEQWRERAEKELGLKKRDVGVIRGKNRTIKPLTIAMQQTLASMDADEWADLREIFGVVICDELQRFAAPTLFGAVDPFPAKYRIGISADESRKDRKEFLIYDLFGNVAANIPRNKLIQTGHVLDVETVIVPTKFSSTTRGDFNLLLEEMMLDVQREELIDELVRHEVATGEQVMILTHRREHAMRIDARLASYGIKSGILLGGADHETIFASTVAGIRSGELRVCVGTVQAIGQGLDIPKLGVGIMTTPIANNRQLFGQVRGRMCRVADGKDKAKIYYLWDKHYYGVRPVKNLIAWNNESMVNVRVTSGELQTKVNAKTFLKRLRASR